jgi:hypothetical protein
MILHNFFPDMLRHAASSRAEKFDIMTSVTHVWQHGRIVRLIPRSAASLT